MSSTHQKAPSSSVVTSISQALTGPTSHATPKAADPAICKGLLEVVEDTGLEQVVDEPTRGKNTLKLMFTNNTTLVNNVQTMPLLTNEADHSTVYIDMNIKPQVCKQPPWKVYKYNKED